MKKEFLSLLIGALFTISCSDLFVENVEQNNNREDFESAWNMANQVYPFFQFKKINWDSLYLKYKPIAVKAKGDEIYNVLYDMFKELRDAHIEIHTKGGSLVPTFSSTREIDRKSFSQIIVSKYFGKELIVTDNNNISYENFNNIGYVYFSTFSNGSWISDFDKILNYFKNTNGLIIDVRNNGGGSGSVTDFIISRFLSETIQYKFYYKSGITTVQSIYPRGAFTYNKPVIILINGASFSAAEMLPETMRQLSNVTIVGDTTGGGGGSNGIYKLPSGKRIKMPFSYFTRLDGSMVEWDGIIPDVVVEQTEYDKSIGVDKQLEMALKILNK